MIVRIASGKKAILSFVFREADNPGLTGDITGVIENDTINLSLPVGTNTDALVPSIEYNGANLSPASGQAADFGIPVTYTVTAEDGSTKSYIVMASQNATIYAASYDSFVYALDAATGRIKWKFQTDSPIRATPILYDSHLFIGSRDGNLYNLDPQTGQLNWKFVTHNPIQSDPVFYKGHVVFTSQAGVAFPGSIFSLNATTGALVWQTALPEAVYPTIGGDIVYCASSGWSSFAFDAATGVEIWRFFQDVTNAVTCVGDGVVYTGGGFAFDCLDAFTGVSLWHKNLDSYFASPTIEKGVLYANLDGEIFAMNPPTGQVYWTYSETHYLSPLGPPTVYNGTVYTSSKNGVLHAINATTGIKKWTFGTYGERTLFYNNVTAANGVVYAGAADSSIVALNEKSGALIWKKKTGGPVWAGVLAVDGRNELYLPGISGNKQ